MNQQHLSSDNVDDLTRLAEDRLAEVDWCAEMILDLKLKHPIRMARVLRDLAWLRMQARKRGHRLAGDNAP